MRDDKPAELNFDLEALSGFEAGVFEPTAGELEPIHLATHPARLARATLKPGDALATAADLLEALEAEA